MTLKKPLIVALFCTLTFSSLTYADITIPMHLVGSKDEGKAIGTITASDTKQGLLLTPHLTDLPPGLHGFHVHENPSCEDHGNAAGAHFDPDKSKSHQGPYSDHGHLGDLPALEVNAQGEANKPLMAPRLKVQDILNRSLMIHAGGDNFSDNPANGGGGARIACGVVKK